MKREIMGTVIYIVVLLLFVGTMWGGLYFLSSRVEQIKVVEVEPGVHCAVTSRIMNTSIDCWKVDE